MGVQGVSLGSQHYQFSSLIGGYKHRGLNLVENFGKTGGVNAAKGRLHRVGLNRVCWIVVSLQRLFLILVGNHYVSRDGTVWLGNKITKGVDFAYRDNKR